MATLSSVASGLYLTPAPQKVTLGVYNGTKKLPATMDSSAKVMHHVLLVTLVGAKNAPKRKLPWQNLTKVLTNAFSHIEAHASPSHN
jgi:hypothetical protein